MKRFKITLLICCMASLTFSQTFNDLPDNEPNGASPQNWDILEGASVISSFQSSTVIQLDNNSIITPSLGSEDYLTNSFTLEFDAYFNEVLKSMTYQVYEIRLWPGLEKVTVPSVAGDGYYAPIEVMRHSVRMDERQGDSNVIKHQATESSLKNKVGTWRAVRLEYNQGKLSVFVNDFELLDISNFNYVPTMISIGTNNKEYDANFNRYIKNISITGIDLDSEETDNGSGSAENENPLNGDYAYTLPKEDGLPNQILQTDGKGTVSWVDDKPDLSHTNTNGENTSGNNTTNHSGLEAINEGNGLGWRLTGRNPDNFGNIGDNAVDLSHSSSKSITRGATASWSTAFGYNTSASLSMSTAFGNETEASGFASTVFGEKSKASGGVSFAAGFESEAKGNYSTALGFKSKALNDFSTAIGNQNRASANSSSAFGTGTVANSESSFVVGTYNSDSFVSGLSNTALFIVGNGTSLTDRKDAFKIFKNGNANLSGTLSQSSDIRLKSNITPLKYGLKEIVELKPVSYNWKSNAESSNTAQTFGLIAQDVRTIIKELVTTDQSEEEMLSLSYIELIPILIKAIQEQQALIEDQNIKIDELSANLSTNIDVVMQLQKRLEQIEVSLKTNEQ